MSPRPEKDLLPEEAKVLEYYTGHVGEKGLSIPAISRETGIPEKMVRRIMFENIEDVVVTAFRHLRQKHQNLEGLTPEMLSRAALSNPEAVGFVLVTMNHHDKELAEQRNHWIKMRAGIGIRK